jgi:hypothetical protein
MVGRAHPPWRRALQKTIGDRRHLRAVQAIVAGAHGRPTNRLPRRDTIPRHVEATALKALAKFLPIGSQRRRFLPMRSRIPKS